MDGSVEIKSFYSGVIVTSFSVYIGPLSGQMDLVVEAPKLGNGLHSNAS